LAPLLLTFLFIGVGWFLIIRPQQERARAQRAVVATLAVGDRVISAGGIHGTVTEVEAETVGLEVAPGIVVTLARPAIARRIDPDDAGSEVAADLADEPAPDTRGGPVEDDVHPENDGPTTGGPA
jgi:preprotein translocase subunit YajC